jgi:hypothetical protein
MIRGVFGEGVYQLWGDRAAIDPWDFFLWPQFNNVIYNRIHLKK